MTSAAEQGSPDFLSDGGEMGRLMRAHDWAGSRLGPPETWPQSLRTSVSTCLNCAFPILIWWGPDLVKLYNDAYKPILGAKHPSALGTPGQLVWPEIWDLVGPMLSGVMTEGRPTRAEDLLLLLHRTGYTEECYFSFSYSPIRDESGGVGGVFCPVIETTDRVIGERRLLLLRRLAEQTITAGSPVAACEAARSCLEEAALRDLPFVAFYLLDGERADTAKLACAVGIQPGGAACPTSVGLADDGGCPWPLQTASVAGETQVVETVSAGCGELPRGAWDMAPKHVAVLPLGSGGPRPYGFMVAGLNPYRPLDEVCGLADLVARQVATVIGNTLAYEAERGRAKALEEIDRAKSVFFANVSHEFRTPLTLLLGPLDEALSHDAPALPPQLRADLDMSRRNALRLQKLVNALLDFSRIEGGAASGSMEATDLAQFTADLASGFRSACQRARLWLEVDCPPLPLPSPAFVDRDMWEKVVLNLLSNAFKFTFEGGIVIRLRADGSQAVLRVEDTGVGIAAEELPRVFDRFHRIEGQRSRTHEGSGIGLALVHELVRLHGGTIVAESVLGSGTIFTVRFPITHATGAITGTGDRRTSDVAMPFGVHAESFIEEALSWLPGADETHEDVLPPIHDGAARARVLLADDNADLRGYTARLLAEWWDVQTVADGQAALDAIAARRPDLVLADIMMPRLDGISLVRAIRATPGMQDLPIILLSARTGEDARIEGLDAGADDYIVKPFSAAELRARVRANLSLAKLRREAVQAIADSEDRLRRMFEQAPGFMCMLRGPDHVLELVNQSYVRLVGQRDLLGKKLRDALPEVEGQGYLELLDQVFWSGEAFAGRGMRFFARRGQDDAPEESFVDFIYQPVIDSAGVVTGIFVEGFDTTERVQAETTLRRLNEELEARVVVEVKAREQIQERLAQAQRMEALGQLAGGIAHDFNNVLQAVVGGLTLIQKRAADEERVRQLAEMTGNAASRGAAITGRLLAFARRGELRSVPVQPLPMLESLREILASTLGVEVTVRIRASSSLPTLLADKAQLETVLINLAVNARDAMPAGGILTISAVADIVTSGTGHATGLRDGPYVRLGLTDTGTGMDAATLARASEPFFTTKPAGQGTGLGLAMARGFVEQSGGALKVQSAPGQGTTVTLWFPQVDAAGAPDEPAKLPQRDSSPVPSARVLLVDDDAMVREVLAGQLEELGYDVAQASDGLAALERLDAGEAVDLLVTDLSMPGMNGLLLINEARRRLPDLPALLLTGYADPGLQLDQESANRTTVLRKPAIHLELAERAAALLRSRPATDA